MSEQLLREALLITRMMAREIAGWRLAQTCDVVTEADVDDVEAEFGRKAAGFPPEGSEGATPA